MQDMTSYKHITAKLQTIDKVGTAKRFRNILANSGEIMELSLIHI